MRKFGVSLNSTDFTEKPEFINQSLKIVRDGVFDFVQLHLTTVSKTSYDHVYVNIKEKMNGIRSVIHAPFYLPPKYLGINTSDKDGLQNNLKILEFSQKCADLLKTDVIIVHPGIGDGYEYVDETIRQFQKMSDSRIAVENLPYNPYGILMHGGRVENIKRIIEETNCKFCLDFGHAICSANSLNRNVYDDFKEYFSLSPDLYHLSDGEVATFFDDHLHLGLGNYDIEKLIKEFTNENSMIVLETFNPSVDVDSLIKDAEYIKKLGLR